MKGRKKEKFKEKAKEIHFASRLGLKYFLIAFES